MTARKLPAASRRRRAGKCDHKGHLDRGAAAVEMALVMPLLIAMIIGIIDFSRIFNAELQLSQAAREGVRLASFQGTTLAQVQARAVLAAPNPAFGSALDPNLVQITTPCVAADPQPPDAVAVVQVSYIFLGIFWMKGSTLTQKAVMRCSG